MTSDLVVNLAIETTMASDQSIIISNHNKNGGKLKVMHISHTHFVSAYFYRLEDYFHQKENIIMSFCHFYLYFYLYFCICISI